jgi:hypothetical protein
MLRSSIQAFLTRGMRRQSRSSVACVADLYEERRNRLAAELSYDPMFRPSFSTKTGQGETGLITGARVVSYVLLTLPLDR